MDLQKPIEKSPQQIMMEKIVGRIAGLGIKGVSCKSAILGPILTGYILKLQPSTPVNKILNRSEDIAYACGVDSVTIERQNDKVIVWVPNEERTIVDFKDALHWFMKDEKVSKMKLPLLLGIDTEGNNSAIDLAEQPHLLVAGSTGSGKSVLESNFVAALSMAKSNDELEMYLVDTKRVDLGLFESLPQLKDLAKDVKDWYLIINSLYSEVQKRNRLLEQAMVRNISEYNLISEKKMPYIVLVIDELADLIEKDKFEKEEYARQNECKKSDHPEPTVIDSIKRLIQICRASGVHIIACTQRTSVDIISGTVKANFPTRISLRLPSSVDSRTILGQVGAEKLLGKGDLLIQRADSDILERYHAPFVNLSDIAMIISQSEMIKESMGVKI